MAYFGQFETPRARTSNDDDDDDDDDNVSVLSLTETGSDKELDTW